MAKDYSPSGLRRSINRKMVKMYLTLIPLTLIALNANQASKIETELSNIKNEEGIEAVVSRATELQAQYDHMSYPEKVLNLAAEYVVDYHLENTLQPTE